ncbi:LOW QUALITY PROTEIN: synaptotagmin-8 [Rhynchonycteris naso]
MASPAISYEPAGWRDGAPRRPPQLPGPLWVPQPNPGSYWTSLPGSSVQPDVDDMEPSPGGAQQWGRLPLSLDYDFGSQEVRTLLRRPRGSAGSWRGAGQSLSEPTVDLKAGDLGGTTDPYACVSLSTQAGHRHKTKVPVSEETCSFRVPPAELPQTTLQVRVLDFKHELLGVLSLPLGAMDLRHVLEVWHRLGPPGTTEVSPPTTWLRPGPAWSSGEDSKAALVPGSGQLTVVMLEAGLSPGPAESYAVKVQLVLNQKKRKPRKTSVRNSTAAPYFNGAFAFLVPFSQIQNLDLVLAVWTRGPRFRAEPVGKVMLGSTRVSGQPLQHWTDMLAHARRPIAQWHRLQPAREVDQALAL